MSAGLAKPAFGRQDLSHGSPCPPPSGGTSMSDGSTQALLREEGSSMSDEPALRPATPPSQGRLRRRRCASCELLPAKVRPKRSRSGGGSFQLLHRASRDPRHMKRVCNSRAASGTEVGLYLVPRTRISVGPAAPRAPRTVAWGFAPLSTHFRLR